MKLLLLLFGLALSKVLWSADAVRTLRTTSEIHALPQLHASANINFDLVGTVVCRTSTVCFDFILKDAHGTIEVSNLAKVSVDPGDTVRASGFIEFDVKCKRWLSALKVVVIRHGPRPDPVEANVSDILMGRHDYQFVRVSGTVIDEFQDDIDRNFHFLLLPFKNFSLVLNFFLH